jgi:ABC-2 type transport system ATP-binding protein
MTAIKFDGVTKTYGDRPALDNVDATLPDATWCVIVGPNGSGKTTFLSLAAGLAEPTTGTVEIGGHAAGSAEARAAVSYLSDSPAFYTTTRTWPPTRTRSSSCSTSSRAPTTYPTRSAAA